MEKEKVLWSFLKKGVYRVGRDPYNPSSPTGRCPSGALEKHFENNELDQIGLVSFTEVLQFF